VGVSSQWLISLAFCVFVIVDKRFLNTLLFKCMMFGFHALLSVSKGVQRTSKIKLMRSQGQ